MSIGSGTKAFVKELVPGSGTLQVSPSQLHKSGSGLTIQVINDEFRHVCHNAQLWSFFEGVPTSTGPASTMIVEKESAIMGKSGRFSARPLR